MSLSKRRAYWFIFFYPFDRKLVGLKTFAASKNEAAQIERAILTACRAGDYRALTPPERECCLRMFKNQGWPLPPDLEPQRPTEELTFGRAMEIFLNYPDIKNSPTKERYIQCLAKFHKAWGPNKPIKSIWVPEIELYQVERLEETDPKTGRKLATPATVNKERGVLSKLFSVLQKLKFVEANPCRLVSRLSEKSGERQVYIALEDFNRILEQLPDWFRPIAQVAYYTGMRRGEIVGLTRKQVDLKKRIIYLGPADTKENQWKRVPIHQDLLPVLEEILSGPIASLAGEIFLRDGRSINLVDVQHVWGRNAKRAGLECRFHDLRHTWKTNARRSGIDPEIRQAIMGHSTRAKSVDERYGWISDEEFVAEIDKISFQHGETRIWVAK